jgi:hypothetical protein
MLKAVNPDFSVLSVYWCRGLRQNRNPNRRFCIEQGEGGRSLSLSLPDIATGKAHNLDSCYEIQVKGGLKELGRGACM